MISDSSPISARKGDVYHANQSIPVGCFYQSGTSSTSTGKVLTNFIQTYTTSGNVQCSTACNSQNFNFYGTVNVGTTSVDCYCGDTLNFVSKYFPRLSLLVWTRYWVSRLFPGVCILETRFSVWEYFLNWRC